MEWDNLRYFLAIARSNSVAVTARRLKLYYTTVFCWKSVVLFLDTRELVEIIQV